MNQVQTNSILNFTPTMAVTTPLPKVPQEPSLRRFTLDEYHRMGEIGLLQGDERLELLEGVVVMMSPIGLPHGQAVFKFSKLLETTIPAGWQALPQQAVMLSDSEPVPDVLVIRGDLLTYAMLPQAKDIGLVIEVSETTLKTDRSIKSQIYAAAGIPEYWIVNLIERKLEVHRLPTAASGEFAARYESIEALGPEASVNVVLDGVKVGTVAVRDVLP